MMGGVVWLMVINEVFECSKLQSKTVCVKLERARQDETLQQSCRRGRRGGEETLSGAMML